MKNIITIIAIIISSQINAQSLTQNREADFKQFKNINQHLSSHSEDTDNDGNLNRKTYFVYDQNDNLIKESIDSNGDGVINEETQTTFNENNQVLTTSFYFGGILDQVYENVYNSDGLLEVATSDDNADGTIDGYTYYFYNSHDLLSEERFDTNGDGYINRKTLYTYNLDKLLIEKKWDNDFNGTIDKVKLFTYDFIKRIKTEKIDLNNNGFVNSTKAWVYDSYGHTINYDEDYDEDGTIEDSYTKVFNNWDKIVSYNRTNQFGYTSEIYTYNNNGNETSYNYYNSNFGIVTEYNFVYYYNSDENKFKQEADHDGDGIIDELTLYYFNTDLQLSETRVDYGVNGVFDAVFYTIYDALGNNIRYEKDYDNDGNIDAKLFYDYGFVNACTTFQEETSYSYKITIPTDGTYIFSLCSDSTNFDSKLFLGDAECLTNLAQNDDFCGQNAEIEYELQANQEVYLTVVGNGFEKENMFNLTVSKKATSPSSIHSIENVSITVFPNPTSDFIEVKGFSNQENTTITIINSLGNNVKQITKASKKIDVSDLSQGIYFLRIENESSISQTKFTIK